jgi:hypothetical protein
MKEESTMAEKGISTRVLAGRRAPAAAAPGGAQVDHANLGAQRETVNRNPELTAGVRNEAYQPRATQAHAKRSR